MLTRRMTLASLCAVGAIPASASADDHVGFDPVTEWGFQPVVPLTQEPSQAQTGTKPPRHGEIAKAFRLLYEAPRDQSPLSVGKYFEDLKDKNEDGNRYNYEWPKDGRANPLIVGFFSSTFTIPSDGDQTSWCAAFLNFCLMASGLTPTGSAQSGSFRNNPNYPQTNDPKPGDITVFRKPGPEGDRGFGHVAFYLDDDGSTIGLLGGNQVGQTRSSGAVCVTRLPFQNSSLELHSFRKISV